MPRTVSSIYTTFLDAPPAACISLLIHGYPPGGLDPQPEGGITSTSLSVGGADGGESGGVVSDQGDGGSAASARTLLVTGTYTLDKETSLRHGTLLLHEVVFQGKPEAIRESDRSIHLNLIQTLPLLSGSVLDVRILSFANHRFFPSSSKLAVATSTGQISIYSLVSGPKPSLRILSTHQVTDEGTLLLSIAVCPQDNLLLAATTSKGTIILVKFADNSFTSFQHLGEIDNAHNSLEAWTSVFSPNGNILYSGGDDASFAAWDVARFRPQISDTQDEVADDVLEILMLFRNRKVHTAGVTAILPVTVSGKEFVFTGSYDQYIRVYSVSTSRWLEGEIDLGGGVWRLEELQCGVSFEGRMGDNSETETVWILASCMHAGCCILKAEFAKDSNDQIEISPVAVMKEHESMNYASACVWNQAGSKKEATFVSTSFYDKRCCCWRI
ncbi:hypothetical protein ABW20_dc0100987 [Dactylellina cionopaga]|nr:hypothetical protein ABW20_dc0100987 [Dactylellina cionopaga]